MMITSKLINDIINNKIVKIKDYEISIKNNTLRVLSETTDIKSIRGVISFSDTTQGHEETIYKATNAYRCGKTGSATFYLDSNGRLHHPRQNGINISIEEAQKRGWKPVKRDSKNRYIYILGINKKEKKEHIKICKIKQICKGEN